MTLFVSDPDLQIHVGDALSVLRTLPDESVHCALTSPPFFALRDYGVDGQIGLEATPEEWCDRLVEVFREVRRVLRSDGTLWVECGDSYAGSWGAQSRTEGGSSASEPEAAATGVMRTVPALGISVNQVKAAPKRTHTGSIPPGSGLKPKDIMGTPWLLAFALRADGWYLRQCIVWHKPNGMPESAKDRCTTSHSYVFLLSKRPRYFFDADAIAEPAAWERWGDQTVTKEHPPEAAAGWIKPRAREELIARGGRTTNGQKPRTDERRGFDNRLERADGQKHPRSVWSIPTEGFAEAHFATWPQKLCERIIRAGTSEYGCCPECGAPWERETEAGHSRISGKGWHDHSDDARKGMAQVRKGQADWDTYVPAKTVGWRPTCACVAPGFQGRVGGAARPLDGHDVAGGSRRERGVRPGSELGAAPPSPVPCVVLDPFLGSGTTALVARRLGRRSIGIELNADYARLAAERTQQLSLLAGEGAA